MRSRYKPILCALRNYNLNSREKFEVRLLSKTLKIKICKTIILPIVLCVCETWSLTLREECKLRVFENRIPRRIFVPKRDENGDLRRPYNAELYIL